MGYKYAKETLAIWQETGAYQQMIPALYKRARSGSSSSSGISSTHRKARSVSIGVTPALPNLGTAATADDNIEQNSSPADSGVSEAPIKRVSHSPLDRILSEYVEQETLNKILKNVLGCRLGNSSSCNAGVLIRCRKVEFY